MARSSRSGRTGGGRGRRDDTSSSDSLEFAEPQRPGRGGSRARSSGGGGGGVGIGTVIPLVVTLIAAVGLLLTGFLTANAAKAGMEKIMDEVGAGAALAIAAYPSDWWATSHGSTNLWDLLQEKLEEAKRQASRSGDSRDVDVVERDFREFFEKAKIEPDPRSKDRADMVALETTKRLQRIVANQANPQSPILHVEVVNGGAALASSGPRPRWDFGPSHDFAGTRVTKAFVNLPSGRFPARYYVAPALDSLGAGAGEVHVTVSAVSVDTASGGLMGTFLLVAVIGIVLVAAASFLLCLGAAKGIKSVTSDLDLIARGDLDVRISARGGGEVAGLARAADRAMKTFRAVQEKSIDAAVAQPAAPVEAAVDVSSILPSEPPRVDGFEIEAVHKPASPGGNDYYDFFTVSDNHIGVVIADMPHAGPQGSFTVATFRALMRAYAPGETSPAAVLGRVNRVMAGELKRGDHITAMYAVLDTDKGVVAVASAGHLPLIFWKLEKKGSALLNPEGIAIGLDKGPVFEKTVVDKRIKLERGDRIVLYTDGPVAATNANDEEFGEQRFYYLVSREAPKNSAAFVNFVANEVDLFHEGTSQQDDITLVTIRKVKE